MERNEFITKYDNAYFDMERAAIEKIKNYGKTFDVYDALRQMLMKERGYKNESEICDDELDDYKWENVYSCVLEDKHGTLYVGNIVKVRYNNISDSVDVYFEDYECCFHEWLYEYQIGWGRDGIWKTILDFID